MRATRILDCLRREEDSLSSIVVIVPVQRFVSLAAIGLIRRVFEEEDDAVNGVKTGELGRIKAEKLLELDIFDA